LVDASLVVPPLIDARPNENTNALLMYLVPLLPFGWQDLSAPESVFLHPWSASWTIKPSDDFARAFAQEIDAARIFREAFNDPRASSGDYLLSGEIVTMSCNAKMFSYCLGVFGPALWFIGLPATHVSNEIEIRLQLAKGSGPAIWSYTVRGEDSETAWLYGGGTDFMYDTIMKAAMPAALASLEAAVRTHAGAAAP
jgi:hypothetical protein